MTLCDMSKLQRAAATFDGFSFESFHAISAPSVRDATSFFHTQLLPNFYDHHQQT